MTDGKALSELSILTFNVFGAPFHPKRFVRTLFRTKVRKRFRYIAEEVSSMNIDILAFQEVHTYLHFFLLRGLLPDYKFVHYVPSTYGPKGGIVTFSKIPVYKRTYIDFKNRGVIWNKSITGPLTRKGMLLTSLEGTNIWILNTHLTQNSDREFTPGNKYTKYLESQLTQCADTVKTLEKDGNIVIAVGDFNVPDTSHLYHEFLKVTNVIDSFADDSRPTYHDWYPTNNPAFRHDYNFFSNSKKISVKEKSYVFTGPVHEKGGEIFLSDHIGLLTRFTLH